MQLLREELGDKVNVDEDTRKSTMTVGDCCTLTFLEIGHSMYKEAEVDNFMDESLAKNLEYVVRVNENLFS